jgi:hypothetical protein
MVVFSEVKRRKRTAMGGIGALGRNARYSSWKTETIPMDTLYRLQLAGDRLQLVASGETREHF